MKQVNKQDIKNAIQNTKDVSINIESCDFYSWLKAWDNIFDLLEHL